MQTNGVRQQKIKNQKKKNLRMQKNTRTIIRG